METKISILDVCVNSLDNDLDLMMQRKRGKFPPSSSYFSHEPIPVRKSSAFYCCTCKSAVIIPRACLNTSFWILLKWSWQFAGFYSNWNKRMATLVLQMLRDWTKFFAFFFFMFTIFWPTMNGLLFSKRSKTHSFYIGNNLIFWVSCYGRKANQLCSG